MTRCVVPVGLMLAASLAAAQAAPAPEATGTVSAGSAPGLVASSTAQVTAAPTIIPVQDVAEIEPVQVPISPTLVERFLKSYPELVDLAKKLEAKKPQQKSTDTEEGAAYALVPYLNDPAATVEINRVLAKHGFANYAEWANVAHSIALAADASDPDSGLDDLDGQRKAAIEELEADTTLSADEKERGKMELEAQFGALQAFVPLPGNRDVVKPYLERLRAIGATTPGG